MASNNPQLISIQPGGIVVVGGGVAGLAAATYLARSLESVEVTLLERASRVGGRAITDIKDGFALNRGVHALYSGGAASSVLKELSVEYSYGRPSHLFALDSRGLHPFPATPLELLRTDLFDAADKRALTRVFIELSTLNATSKAHESVTDWILKTAKRARVRQLLVSIARVYTYSDALDLVSADTFVSRLQQTIRHPVHYIDGGWQALVDGLRNAALAAGVRIIESSGVAGVSLKYRRASAVKLRDGTELACSHLLLATPPRDALRILTGQSAPDLQRIVSTSVPAVVACLDLALKHLPSAAHPVAFDLEQPRFVTVQSLFARLAPNGSAVIHAFKQLDPRRASDPRVDRADLDTLLDRVQPGWRALVIEQQFLPRMLASSTLPLASDGGLAARPEYQSRDIGNVYFAGDWVGPRGFLVDASLDSARESARLIAADRASTMLPARRAA